MTANQDAADNEFSAHELLRMDESEARETLTVNQFQRWESIQDIHEQAADNQDEWDAQADRVADVTVRADMEALGTRVEIFGNDLLVHADPEDPTVREGIERLESEFGDADAAGDISDDDLDAYADLLLTLLDAVLVKWGDTEWAEIASSERDAVLADVRAKWGVDGLTTAWGDIAMAIREDREEVVEDIEKFRDPERRGDR